ncbi:MAG: polysaccharide biosynthesis protein [Chloroflexi bacterium]|nr:polysaccharide biosynthesis protein [Chloroflexota bacterium]
MYSSSNISTHWDLGTVIPLRGRLRRRAVLALFDMILLSMSMVGAFLLVASPEGLGLTTLFMIAVLGIAIVTRTGIMALAGIYSVDWRRLTAFDLATLLRTLVVGTLFFALVAYSAAALGLMDWLPVRVLILDFLLSILLIFGSKAAMRSSRDFPLRERYASARTVLIVGAGEAGMQVARALREDSDKGFKAVGFIDDDPGKQGLTIQGVRVQGTRSEMEKVVARSQPDEIWIAMPSAPDSVIRETLDLARETGLERIKMVPGNKALLTGVVAVDDMDTVDLEQLLGRETVRIDTPELVDLIRNRTVLVTGASGSIGSEICRQVARLEPSVLLLIDQDETGIYDLHREIAYRYPKVRVKQIVGDVRDAARIDGLFELHRPGVVFHAAAYKHVPLMEDHPDQAVITNVFGTKVVAEAARRWNADKFVLISTDKAVNPMSVMGATKRAAEVTIRHIGEGSTTDFIAVRFGNVLGSRGSVVPVFRDQIARGGPVTVTDPGMVRYFMTIPEAVSLVLQAGTVGENGEVLVLDMGEPVKIVDLARQVIRMSGFEPDRDIPIVFTGIRPGEKLFEDILSAEEGTNSTHYDRIFVANVSDRMTREELRAELDSLEQAATTGHNGELLGCLQRIVPTYTQPAPVEPFAVGTGD